jgi:UDP-GlcNAc3NAcA epimerase
MIRLEQSARVIVTDSGGVQKEAFFYEVPCVTMRDETEWTETVELGLNVLVGADRNLIAKSLSRKRSDGKLPQPYGNGNASEAILEEMLRAP